jgi:alkylation response protein AidB-like acyl-CoA dehydrogenase
MDDLVWWNDAQRKLRADVREAVDEVLLPLAERDMQRNVYPWEAVREIAKRGWFGVLVPEEYGGSAGELGVTGCAMLCEELARTGSLASVYGGTAFGAAHQLIHNGTEEQKRRWLPRMARGELLGAITMTEPFAGSDISGIETTATRDGDHYVVDGIKRFQTSAGAADLYMTYVKTSDEAEAVGRHRHLTGMIIEKGTPGFSIERFNVWAGAPGMYNVYMRFDDVRVPVSNVIGAEGEGWTVMMSGVNVERTLNAAYYLGVMREAIRYARQHLERRVQFGRTTGSVQVNQFKMADMYTRLQTARLLVYYSALCADRGLDVPVEGAMAKLYGSEAAFEVVREAIQCMGGNGVMQNYYPTARALGQSKQAEIAAGTNEIMRLLISRMAGTLYAHHFPAPVRVYDEDIHAPVPLGQPPERRPVADAGDVLAVLAEDYRVNPGLHMTLEDLRVFLDVSEEDLVRHLEELEGQGLAGIFRDRKGRVTMARASLRGIKQAYPPEHYRYIPPWVAEGDAF